MCQGTFTPVNISGLSLGGDRDSAFTLEHPGMNKPGLVQLCSRAERGLLSIACCLFLSGTQSQGLEL